jgi:2-haloacid dehalogenase
VLSVETTQTYKPAPAPYQLALTTASCDLSDAWMVACHDWDLAGARAVGMNTAFVERSAMSYATTWPAPELSVPDFAALAEALIDTVS